MNKLFKTALVLVLLLSSVCFGGASRLYIGELDGQFMAGVDTRIDFNPFYVGGDVRTIIRKTVFEEEDKVVGFMPDRTDYKTFIGLNFGGTEIEYGHTCYHRVISSEDLSFYTENKQLPNTDSITIRFFF